MILTRYEMVYDSDEGVGANSCEEMPPVRIEVQSRCHAEE